MQDIDLHIFKVLRERLTLPLYCVQFSPNSRFCVPLKSYVWKCRLGSVFIKSVTRVWACEESLTDWAWWRCFVSTSCGVCCYRAVLSVRIKISRIPSISQTTYWILETLMEPPVIWKENTLWTVFPTIDCLLGCSNWFWFSSFQHSNDFFSLCQAGIKLSLVQWCMEAAIQHFRWHGSTERVCSLTSCAAMEPGEYDWPVFAECFLPHVSTWFLFDAAGVALLNCCDPMQWQLKQFLLFTHQRLLYSWTLFWKDDLLEVSHEK